MASRSSTCSAPPHLPAGLEGGTQVTPADSRETEAELRRSVPSSCGLRRADRAASRGVRPSNGARIEPSRVGSGIAPRRPVHELGREPWVLLGLLTTPGSRTVGIRKAAHWRQGQCSTTPANLRPEEWQGRFVAGPRIAGSLRAASTRAPGQGRLRPVSIEVLRGSPPAFRRRPDRSGRPGRRGGG